MKTPTFLLLKNWQDLNQTHWQKQWDNLVAEPFVLNLPHQKEKQEKRATQLIEKGLVVQTQMMFEALEKGWILTLGACYKQREKKGIEGWPRNKKGQNLLHLFCSVPNHILSDSLESQRLIRNNWTQSIIEYETGILHGMTFKNKGTKSKKDYVKILFSQPDHEGITPWMCAMRTGVNPIFDPSYIDWTAQDHQGKTAWHHWAEGLVERAQNLKSTSRLDIRIELSKFLSRLSLLEKREHQQAKKAWSIEDNNKKEPWDILLDLPIEIFKMALLSDEELFLIPKIIAPSEDWLESRFSTLYQKNMLFLLEITNHYFYLNEEQWLCQNKEGVAFCKKALRHPLFIKWLVTLPKESEHPLNHEKIWKTQNQGKPLYQALENYILAYPDDAYTKIIQSKQGWQNAKIKVEKAHLQQVLSEGTHISSKNKVRL